MPRIKPGAAGWVERALPLCYATPQGARRLWWESSPRSHWDTCVSFLMGHSRPLYLYFCLFWIAIDRQIGWNISMSLSGFAPRISSVRSSRSANCATNPAILVYLNLIQVKLKITLFYFSSLYRHLVQWYREVSWPWDWEETILGLRYSLTGILLFAAFVSLVFTFIAGPAKRRQDLWYSNPGILHPY